MQKLFDSIIKGLVSQGYIEIGGGEMYALLRKDNKTVKVFIPLNSNCFTVRYS